MVKETKDFNVISKNHQSLYHSSFVQPSAFIFSYKIIKSELIKLCNNFSIHPLHSTVNKSLFLWLIIDLSIYIIHVVLS